MRWADLPERYGRYKSVQERFIRWAEAGVWDRLFDDLVRDRKNPCLMLDSTIVRAHQQAATGPQKRGEDKALGRSRGGLSTKIPRLANGLGEPIAFRLTGGHAGEYAEAIPLLTGRQADIVIADRGYDSSAIVCAIEAMGACTWLHLERYVDTA